MLEFLLCSLVTILPDYLYRSRIQGKSWGQELTFFSIWYELRWGLTACALLTISLITLIFYYHPTSTNVSSFFRTVTILTESAGRVSEIYVRNGGKVAAGDPIFRLDDSVQKSEVETLRQRMNEIDAAMVVARSELEAAGDRIEQAESNLRQAEDELARTEELRERSPNAVAEKEIDRLSNLVDARRAAVHAAEAERDAVRAKLETQLPAQKDSAAAQLEEAQARLDKMVVHAGTAGTVKQFALEPGDVVSPIMRPAGILVPENGGDRRFQAGFGQISAQVLKTGMVAEMTCFSKPFTIVPMVVTSVQDVIAAGQFRPTDQLRDVQDAPLPGTVTVTMEPLYEGGADAIPPGSRCIANAYTSFHDRLDDEELGLGDFLFYHMVDAVGIAHAAILRIQALLFPVQTLVFTGH